MNKSDKFLENINYQCWPQRIKSEHGNDYKRRIRNGQAPYPNQTSTVKDDLTGKSCHLLSNR